MLQVKTVQFYFKMFNWYKNYNVLAVRRIPERVVHARGTGAYGEFIATKDLSDLTIASLFKAGTKTPVFVRMSTVIHGKVHQRLYVTRTVSQ
jgi:catalase